MKAAKKRLFLLQPVTEEQRERIESEFPELEVIDRVRDRANVTESIRHAEIVYGWNVTRDQFVQAQRLEWIHIMSQGVEHMMYPELVDSAVILTNGRGSFSQACAEHAVMMILALYRNLPLLLRCQQDSAWRSEPVDMELLHGKTVGCLGTGSIGQCVARLCAGFGCRVIGCNKPRREISLFETVYESGQVHELLARSDVVVNALPLTKDTHHFMGASEFQQMKPTALFTNIGRGKTVDEQALVKALQTSEIAGAGLDVTEQEPLPPDSPLWTMDNVIITSHKGGRGGVDEQERSFQILFDNLRRYQDGRPLLNQVDKDAGF